MYASVKQYEIIRGWGDEHNREIGLCRAVRGVCACARSGCLVEFGLEKGCVPFPFCPRAFPFSLERSGEFHRVLMSSNVLT